MHILKRFETMELKTAISKLEIMTCVINMPNKQTNNAITMICKFSPDGHTNWMKLVSDLLMNFMPWKYKIQSKSKIKVVNLHNVRLEERKCVFYLFYSGHIKPKHIQNIHIEFLFESIDRNDIEKYAFSSNKNTFVHTRFHYNILLSVS